MSAADAALLARKTRAGMALSTSEDHSTSG